MAHQAFIEKPAIVVEKPSAMVGIFELMRMETAVHSAAKNAKTA
jgi:hypothetical protein